MFRPLGSTVLPFWIKKASLALRIESRLETKRRLKDRFNEHRRTIDNPITTNLNLLQPPRYGIYLRVFTLISNDWARRTSEISSEHEKINSISLQASMYYSVYYINTAIIHSQTETTSDWLIFLHVKISGRNPCKTLMFI